MSYYGFLLIWEAIDVPWRVCGRECTCIHNTKRYRSIDIFQFIYLYVFISICDFIRIIPS